jgi:hypothetical protein
VLQLLFEQAGGGVDWHVATGLCRLPAAAQLSSEQVVQLLQAAVDSGSEVFIVALENLPAAARPSSDQLLRVIDAANGRSGNSKHDRCAIALYMLLGAVRCHEGVDTTLAQTIARQVQASWAALQQHQQ